MAAIIPWLPDVLKAQFAGVPDVRVVVWSGWDTRSANTTTFIPRGVLDHDTGSAPGSSYLAVVRYCIDGASFAPVCHYLTGPDGPGKWRVDVICGNRANHGGQADDTWDDFDAWVADAANTFTIGAEHFWTMESGRQWDPRHLWVQMQCDVAILKKLGRNENHRFDHKQYATGRKFDRRHIDTDKWKRDLAVALKGGTVPPPSTETPTTGIAMYRDLVFSNTVSTAGDQLQRDINDVREARGQKPIEIDGAPGKTTATAFSDAINKPGMYEPGDKISPWAANRFQKIYIDSVTDHALLNSRVDDRGDTIRQLQVMLHDLGYPEALDKQPGVWGDITTRDLAKATEMKESGRLDLWRWRRLVVRWITYWSNKYADHPEPGVPDLQAILDSLRIVQENE